MIAPAPISAAIAPNPLAPPVVLASASGVRRRLLENAGVPVIVDPGRADEEEIKRAMHADVEFLRLRLQAERDS